jgi:hypothetical protein
MVRLPLGEAVLLSKVVLSLAIDCDDATDVKKIAKPRTRFFRFKPSIRITPCVCFRSTFITEPVPLWQAETAEDDAKTIAFSFH